jgi:hypothetical protein
LPVAPNGEVEGRAQDRRILISGAGDTTAFHGPLQRLLDGTMGLTEVRRNAISRTQLPQPARQRLEEKSEVRPPRCSQPSLRQPTS